jgi:adenine-specific DNA-methyltransferase
MVDEALKAYLAQALCAALPTVSPADAQVGLDVLFAYTDKTHAFTPQETAALIAAIDNCNILDPACGSGAYPMGILHKLVFILRKLDENNQQWKQRQIDKAYDIEDVQARDSAVRAIQRDFEDNNLDYGRKLYLIENCIYGVDIQPIAIQIAKLRFFISLICDQKTSTDTERNLGVRPLPNLEIKFIAANTLMPLQLPSERSLFESTEVIDLETKLEKVRHHYFSARTRKEKISLSEQDQALRNDIIAHLQANDFGNAQALRRVQWNPYDSHAVADLYHTATMFGPALAAGFDVVIGNPPYVRADGDADYMAKRRDIVASKHYKTLWEKWDLYIPFIELGYQLLKPGGITTMIVSDAYCHAKYAQKSQTWFLQNAVVLRLDFLSNIQVFQAAVRNVIYFYQRGAKEGEQLAHTPQRRLHGSEFGDVTLLPSAPQAALTYRAFFPDDAPKLDYACTTVPLADVCYISVGMVINADEKAVQSAFKTRDLLSPVQAATHPKRFVEDKNLSPWRLAEHSWLEWGTARAPSQFRRQTFPELYDHASKLMLPMVGEIRAALDEQQTLCNHGIFVAVPWHQLQGVRNRSLKGEARYADEMPKKGAVTKGGIRLREPLETTSQGFDNLFLLGVLNSNTAKTFLRANRRNNIQLYPEDWKQLPIPVVSPAAQTPVVALVQGVLEALAHQDAAAAALLHEQLHGVVAGLYGVI